MLRDFYPYPKLMNTKKLSMNNKLFFFLFVLFVSLNLVAQQKEISGIVKDSDGNPLPGANVLVKNDIRGVVTDIQGVFKIKALSTDTLIISFLGYLSEEKIPGTSNFLEISLIQDITTLDEVVVTALGISREAKSLGYARQSVSTEELTEARDPNIVNTLSGKVAGLQVISNGGPTSSSMVIIRGMTSLTGNNQPIWVIDGVPIINTMGTGGRQGLDYGNDAADLSPDMIESIEVLKGANAAALYGSMGQNGAILITTKKGSSQNRLGVSLSSNVMFHQVREFPDYQNVYGAGHVMSLGRDATERDTVTGVPILGKYFRSWGMPMLGQEVINYNGELTTYDASPDNVKEYYQVGRVFTNNLTLEQAFEKGSFRLSYTNVVGSDIIPEHDLMHENNFNLKVIKDFSKFLKADVTAMWSHEKVHNRIFRNWDARNPANTFIYMTRNTSLDDLNPWKQPDGTSFHINGGDNMENPLWVLNELENEDTKDRLISSITLSGNITKGLSYRAKVDHDFIHRTGYDFSNWGAIGYDPDGSLNKFINKQFQTNIEALVSYNAEIRDFFTYSINIGANQRDNRYDGQSAFVSSLLLPDMISLNNSLAQPLVSEGTSSWRTKSVFAFANFGYKNMVFLDVTGRTDWSSSLPVKNADFFYPSVSTSLIYSDIFNIREDILPFGKIRLSAAKVGNGTGPYRVFDIMEKGGFYNGTPIVFKGTTRNNRELKNEETFSYEIGLDNRFFNNRVSLDLTLYKTKTIGQIITAKVSTVSGYNEKVINSGRIDNKGIELSMGVTPIKNRNFNWYIHVNWSKNINKVVSLADSIPRFLLGEFLVNMYAEVGQPYGTIRGNVQAYSSDGKLLLNENGENISVEDGYLGNAFPDWIGSVKNSFRYKNFELGVLVDFMKGGTLYSVGHHKAQVWGNTISSLEGREEWWYSTWVLGESDDERRGNTIDGNVYADDARNKGIYIEGYYALKDENNNYIIDENGNYVAGEQAHFWQLPQNWWQSADNLKEQNTFDRSFIKLREVTLGYTIPKSILKTLPIDRIRVSAVGRNLWTIFKNTPRGIDPEATSSVGNDQGVEFGSSLPTAYYGFDFKVTF